MKYFVTGGAGFIGSNLINYFLKNTTDEVLVYDDLTYSGNIENLSNFFHDSRFTFVKGNICDEAKLNSSINEYAPDKILHLAAETHVDRSIDNPKVFIESNIIGTANMLNTALVYFKSLDSNRQKLFLFHHISTDEVYGELGEFGKFTEETPYDPSSPYSASKAASDHLVRAWGRTYGLPYVITNCSNNYGPCQYPEKLIPLTIKRALSKEVIPVYGNGKNIRDWLFVDDHAEALVRIVNSGFKNTTYNIGGGEEKQNIEVVLTICNLMNEMLPTDIDYKSLIKFVTDRPGHDFRYAIDFSKLHRDIGWSPKNSFENGLKKTVAWYVERYKSEN